MTDHLAADHMAFPVPDISQADLYSFHEAHFSSDATRLFEADFLRPRDWQPDRQDGGDGWDAAYGYEDAGCDGQDDDDGLGYYTDGVKRTLTDEQIAMFRHSEVEALKRAETKGAGAAARPASPVLDEEYWEEGELAASEGEIVASPGPETKKQQQQKQQQEENSGGGGGGGKSKSKKRKRGKGGRNGGNAHHHQPLQQEPKVDLRKRTWDVVEKGFVGGLNYDEAEAEQAALGRPAQRRHISYDDDD